MKTEGHQVNVNIFSTVTVVLCRNCNIRGTRFWISLSLTCGRLKNRRHSLLVNVALNLLWTLLALFGKQMNVSFISP